MDQVDAVPDGYLPPGRQPVPLWLWGLGTCACLPILLTIFVGILAYPAMKKFRDAQREALRTPACLSNIRQIATALQSYSADYDDRYPVATSWVDGASVYTQSSSGADSTFRCPSARFRNRSAYGYAFNALLSGSPRSKIRTPAQIALVYDSSNLSKNHSDPMTSLPNPPRHRSPRLRAPKVRLNIMGYVDGHARAVGATRQAVSAPGLEGSE